MICSGNLRDDVYLLFCPDDLAIPDHTLRELVWLKVLYHHTEIYIWSNIIINSSHVWYHHHDSTSQIQKRHKIFQFASVLVTRYFCMYWLITLIAGSWGQHGAHLGLTGHRWAPCWPHELCYLSRAPYISHDICLPQGRNLHAINAWVVLENHVIQQVILNISSHTIQPIRSWVWK